MGLEEVRQSVISRREEYAQASRRALLDSARARFTTDGYVATSLDTIAADARMTKGAVYHHFANKQALFEAVLEEVELDTVEEVTKAAAGATSVWEASVAGLDRALDRFLEPTYQRLVFEEAPIALGYIGWHEHGEKHELSLIRSMAQSLADEDLLLCDDIDMLAQVLFGAVSSGALALRRADDPEAAKGRLREILIRLVKGLAPH